MNDVIQKFTNKDVILTCLSGRQGGAKDRPEAPQMSLVLFGTLSFLILSLHVFSQLPARQITASMYADQLDQLKKDYNVKKTIPIDFELATLIALSRYPELKELRIDIQYHKIRTTMEARPTMCSVFRRKAKRRYKVVINSKEEKLGKAALKNVPFDAQVGVLAHEFAHIRMYNTKNVFGLIGIGISYSISKKYREKFEKENDRETINRGFGWQVYHFTHYILNETDVSEKYKKYKRRIYYEPKELKKLINAK